MSNYAVILAGGVGSRFWPFSRELEPKQFMQIKGKLSLLQATVKRLSGVILPRNIYIITNRAYFYEIKKQIHDFAILEENIIFEPVGKNTAPAIGICAKFIHQLDRDATLVVLPSDHYINNANQFRLTLKEAIAVASGDLLVTIGIKPKNPSTGYGYIKVHSSKFTVQSSQFKVHSVERFLEKPNLAQAKKYFKDKRFFWNSGIFVWKASVFLEELERYLPNLYLHLKQINSQEDLDKIWPKIKAISVDYGIMEYSKRIALVPAGFLWTDLGSWDALTDILPKDKKGNIIQVDSLDFGSRGLCIFGRGKRLISTVGLKDVIIADTPDALLVCDKYKTQEVRKIVDCLKLAHRKEHFVHITDKRPWGLFTVLQTGPSFKIKLIEILPKKRLSLQKHIKRAEHWVVLAGIAKVTSGKKIKFVRSNQSIYIPKGKIHRLENPGDTLLKIVEVQTGDYLEEDDIIRLSDDFKR